jgi:hypothetical protein
MFSLLFNNYIHLNDVFNYLKDKDARLLELYLSCNKNKLELLNNHDKSIDDVEKTIKVLDGCKFIMREDKSSYFDIYEKVIKFKYDSSLNLSDYEHYLLYYLQHEFKEYIKENKE